MAALGNAPQARPVAPFPSQSFAESVAQSVQQDQTADSWPSSTNTGFGGQKNTQDEQKLQPADDWKWGNETPQRTREEPSRKWPQQGQERNGGSPFLEWQLCEPSPWDKEKEQSKEGAGKDLPPRTNHGKHSRKYNRSFVYQPGKANLTPMGGFTNVYQPKSSWDQFVKRGTGGGKEPKAEVDISSAERRKLEEGDRDFAAAVQQLEELAMRERILAPHHSQSLDSTDGKILAQAIRESMETYKTEAHHRQGKKEVSKEAVELAVEQKVVLMPVEQGSIENRRGPAVKDTVCVNLDRENNEKDLQSLAVFEKGIYDLWAAPSLDPDLPVDFKSEDVDKSSDESLYSDDGQQQYTEKRPLGRGWQYATYLGTTTDPRDPNKTIMAEMFDIFNGFVQIQVSPETADQIKHATFVRYKKGPNGGMKIAPSKHLCARATAVKVRPGRSVEIRTTAVVAFTHACNSSAIPIWCDPMGWLQLDITKPGVLRRGTERDLGWSAFKPLKIIELTVKVRLDVEFASLPLVRDGIVISDVVQVAHVDKNGIELPSQYFPQAPRRFYNLRLVCTKPNSEGLYKFDSKRHPSLALLAHKDQYAYHEKMKYDGLPMAGVFVKVAVNQYRALIVGPVQVIMYNSKDRIFDYRRAPVARKYKPMNMELMEMIKAKGAELDKLDMEKQKKAAQNSLVFL